MTHTLHPEIEKILDAITLDYFLQSGEAGKKIDYKQRMKDKIVKHLGPYIRMPTDQKDSEKSIPKIEKIDMTGVDMGQSHFGSDRVLMRLYEKQCEIIDRLNTLPTK